VDNGGLTSDLPPQVRGIVGAMHQGQLPLQQPQSHQSHVSGQHAQQLGHQQVHQQPLSMQTSVMEAQGHRPITISDMWIYDARYVQQIGIRVRRFFPGRGRCDGTIIASLPADANGGIPLWRVRYDYGEDEIIDQRALVQYRQYFLGDTREDPAITQLTQMHLASGPGHTAPGGAGHHLMGQHHHHHPHIGVHHPVNNDDGKSDSDNDNDQVLEYASHPDYNHLDDDAKLALLRKRYRDAGFINGRSIECLTKDGILLHRFVNIRKIATKLKFPLHGIRACLMGMQHSSSGFIWRYYDEANVSLDERPISLKKILEIRRKSYKGPSATGRKCGRPSLNSKMLAELPPVRSLDEDKMAMLEEGWTFDARVEKRIGLRVRRFFPGFGKSDGTIVAYLPPEVNEGECLWHVLHDDGDREDIDIGEVDRYIQYIIDDVQSDPSPALSQQDIITPYVLSTLGMSQQNPASIPLIPISSASSSSLMMTPGKAEIDPSTPAQKSSTGRRRAGRPRLSGAALAGEYSIDESIVTPLLPASNVSAFDATAVVNSGRIYEFAENFTAWQNQAGSVFQYMAEREVASFAISLRGLEQHVPALRGYVEGLQGSQFLAFSGVKLLVLDHASCFPVDYSNILAEWCSQNKLARDDVEDSLTRISEEMMDMSLQVWHQSVVDVYLGLRKNVLGDAIHLHSAAEIIRSKTFRDIVNFFSVFLPLVVPTRSTKKVNLLRMSQFMRCYFAIRHFDDMECLSILPTLAVSVIRPVSIPADLHGLLSMDDYHSSKPLKCTFDVDLSDVSDDDMDMDSKPHSRRSSIGSGHKAQHKPVEQIDMKTGKVLRRYASQGHAADKMKCTQGVISYCCRGERSHAYNFKWRFYRGPREDFYEDDSVTGYVPIKDLLAMRFHNAVGFTRSKVDIKGTISATTWDAGNGDENSGDVPDVKFYCSHIKPIEQIDLKTGRVLRRYLSGASAAKHMECSQAVVSLCCRSQFPRSIAHNFCWRFYRGPPIDFDSEENSYVPLQELLDIRHKPSDEHAIKYSNFTVRPVHQLIFVEKIAEQGQDSAPSQPTEMAVDTTEVIDVDADNSGSNETVPAAPTSGYPGAIIVMRYPTIKQAGAAMNLTSRSILLSCEGVAQTAGGFGWRFCEDPAKEGKRYEMCLVTWTNIRCL
jgi:hypothetical protein